ncbi:hypothetical protein QF015_000643 [Paenarthrobacter sp. TE4293]|uniref:hypothetical protein n=1 Tax=Paenarthrobacter sp. TE4293 TaxID=3381695 RepID=UPI003D1FA031
MPNLYPALSTDDWHILNTGDRVVAQRPNVSPCLGTIGDVSEDASIIWVWLDGQGRIRVIENHEVTFPVGIMARRTYQVGEDNYPPVRTNRPLDVVGGFLLAGAHN